MQKRTVRNTPLNAYNHFPEFQPSAYSAYPEVSSFIFPSKRLNVHKAPSGRNDHSHMLHSLNRKAQ